MRTHECANRIGDENSPPAPQVVRLCGMKCESFHLAKTPEMKFSDSQLEEFYFFLLEAHKSAHIVNKQHKRSETVASLMRALEN